jgi:molybdopterin-guanine dinucleotide biosynthesis protein A
MSARFSAVLLAGGKSSRMQRDKAFIEIGSVPLWRRQLRLLQELQPHEIFIAGPRRAEWENEGCTIISDVEKDAGPLAGLTAGLRRCSTPLLLTLAVDLPEMTTDYLRELLAHEAGIVPHLELRFEPLAAVYPVTALSLAQSCLDSGDYSLQRFVSRCAAEALVRLKTITPAEEPFFLNMNTPEDLRLVINE